MNSFNLLPFWKRYFSNNFDNLEKQTVSRGAQEYLFIYEVSQHSDLKSSVEESWLLIKIVKV